jgi:hypothetical protein
MEKGKNNKKEVRHRLIALTVAKGALQNDRAILSAFFAVGAHVPQRSSLQRYHLRLEFGVCEAAML